MQLSVGIYLKGAQIPQLPILQPSPIDTPKRKIQHHLRINVQLHVYYVLNKYDYEDALPNTCATHKHNDFSHAIHQVIYRIQTISRSTRAAFQNSSRTASFKNKCFLNQLVTTSKHRHFTTNIYKYACHCNKCAGQNFNSAIKCHGNLQLYLIKQFMHFFITLVSQ